MLALCHFRKHRFLHSSHTNTNTNMALLRSMFGSKKEDMWHSVSVSLQSENTKYDMKTIVSLFSTIFVWTLKSLSKNTFTSISSFISYFRFAMTTRHQCDQNEHYFVAEALNYEQIIRGESEAAMAWTGSWSKLYAPSSPKSYRGKLETLRQKMENFLSKQWCPTPVIPYREFGKDYKRKSLSKNMWGGWQQNGVL